MKPEKSNIIRIILWLVMLIDGAVLGIYFNKISFSELFDSLIFHAISFAFGYILLRMVLKAARMFGRLFFIGSKTKMSIVYYIIVFFKNYFNKILLFKIKYLILQAHYGVVNIINRKEYVFNN